MTLHIFNRPRPFNRATRLLFRGRITSDGDTLRAVRDLRRIREQRAAMDANERGTTTVLRAVLGDDGSPAMLAERVPHTLLGPGGDFTTEYHE